MEKSYLKKRFLALLIDYIIIWIYLILLFLTFSIIYILFFDEFPEFNEISAHLMAFFTTVLPVTLAFSYMESRHPYATPGKKRTGLAVGNKIPLLPSSLLRNAFKFLPWHIGHTGVIRAMYQDYSVFWFMVGNAGFVLAGVYVLMVLFRDDHRHLPDMIAGAEVGAGRVGS